MALVDYRGGLYDFLPFMYLSDTHWTVTLVVNLVILKVSRMGNGRTKLNSFVLRVFL